MLEPGRQPSSLWQAAPSNCCRASLDDIDVGALDGQLVDEYRLWKSRHRRTDRLPGGESLDGAALRYARALVARPERVILVVCHEIAIRQALTAAAGADDLDRACCIVPNARPCLFSTEALTTAAVPILAAH